MNQVEQQGINLQFYDSDIIIVDDNIDEDITVEDVHSKIIKYTEKETHTLVLKKRLSRTGVLS